MRFAQMLIGSCGVQKNLSPNETGSAAAEESAAWVSLKHLDRFELKLKACC
jgi:hypothetical protein